MFLLISNCNGEIALKDLPIIFQLLIGVPVNISCFIDKGLLVNRSRAFEVMDRFNLQGLVALDPINGVQ